MFLEDPAQVALSLLVPEVPELPTPEQPATEQPTLMAAATKAVTEKPAFLVLAMEAVTEPPDISAAAIFKKPVFAFHLMAVLRAWAASESTPEPAPVREPS